MPRKMQKLPPFEKIKYRVKHFVRFVHNEDYTKIAGLIGVSYCGKSSTNILKFAVDIVDFEESYKSKWPSALDNEIIYMLLEYIIITLSQRIFSSLQYAKYTYSRLCIYRPRKSLVKKWKSKLL